MCTLSAIKTFLNENCATKYEIIEDFDSHSVWIIFLKDITNTERKHLLILAKAIRYKIMPAYTILKVVFYDDAHSIFTRWKSNKPRLIPRLFKKVKSLFWGKNEHLF
jgi:hypothetical protein